MSVCLSPDGAIKWIKKWFVSFFQCLILNFIVDQLVETHEGSYKNGKIVKFWVNK